MNDLHETKFGDISINNTITTEQKFSSRVIQRASVLTLCTALLVSLVACADYKKDTSDASNEFSAPESASMEALSNSERTASLYSDASNSIPATTEGFVGEFVDDTIRITWIEDPDATGYNVYRQGKYYTTVFKAEFHDADILVQDYSYEITSFVKNGKNTRYYRIATGLIVSVPPKPVTDAYFESPTTEGFVGDVLEDTIRVSWKRDPDATGYNIYRQGMYYTTVFETEFHDTDILAQDYSYEITSFVKNGKNTRYYRIATGLTVSVPPKTVTDAYFRSPTTDGFVGEVLDDTIRVSWKRDSDATGYNIYRQGKYYTTVFETEFRDTDILVQDYSYRITAFVKSKVETRYYTIATGLTVTVRTLRGTDADSPNADTDLVYTSESINSDRRDTGNNVIPVPITTTREPDTTALGSSDADSTNTESIEARSSIKDSVTIDSANLDTSDIITTPVESLDTAQQEPINNKQFESLTTKGFVGEVLGNSIRISWNEDSEANGYNVYRQSKYHATVFTNEFHDTEVYDQNYYYEIQAFEHQDNKSATRYYSIATGLTVSARTLGRINPDKPYTNDNLMKDYELVFVDEFNGSSLDASKWNTSYLWGTDLTINSEEQYYVDILRDPEFGFNPFTFDGDNLTINTIRTPPELIGKSQDQPYLSGILTSYDAFKFTYGYAEVRAKMTHGRGYWPAFWLLNAYYGGEDPEIDVMEFIGDNQDVVYHTFHYYDDNGKLRSSRSEPTTGIDFTADFHTFAVEWKPGSIVYYVDGMEAHRITDPKVPQEQMYLIANSAVGGWWAGSPDESTPFPGKFVIDYIRVYQKAGLPNDMLFDDSMTEIPYANEIPNQVLPNHRPHGDQWLKAHPFY